MTRRAALFGVLIATANLVGCGESIPPPPGGDPQASWPDEVKQAEGAFQEKAAKNATKKGR